jgi:Holliday junction resolvasome RuvABC endonuclease subunit
MICLGFDAGSRKSAFALLESRGGRSARFSGITPITVTLIQKGMVASTDAALEHLLDEVLCDAPDTFAIEKIDGYAFAATSTRGGGQAVVKALLETKGIEEKFRGLCRHRGEVVDITAAQWRKSVCGRGNASKHLIAMRIPQVVIGVRSSNEHTRDAIGAALAVIWSKGGRA